MKRIIKTWLNPAPRLFVFAIIGWLVATSVGLGIFWHYKTTGHVPRDSALSWPEQSELQLASAKPTLVLFAHPLCPCTMASLVELTRVLQESAVQPSVTIALYQPAQAGAEWQTSPLVDAVREIPGAEVVWDREGNLAKLFAATTSGQVQLYDPQGKCLFNGGVTRLRGHKGESAASRLLHTALQGNQPAMIRSPIYGCDL